MSNLLVAEEPLVILPSLATAIGLKEAIAVQQLHYWTVKMNPEDGWIYNTIEDWKGQFPFWPPRTIRRVWSTLRDRGMVEVQQRGGRDRRNHYRLVYSKIPAELKGPKRPQQHKAKLDASSSSSTETTTDNPPTPKGGEQVRDIFGFWQEHHDKPQHQLTDKRKRKVQQRLKEPCTLSAPYSPERVRELKEAIYGARYSPHHMGTKADSTRPYNDLEIILRDRDQVDAFRALFVQHRGKTKNRVDVNARRKEVRKRQGLA